MHSSRLRERTSRHTVLVEPTQVFIDVLTSDGRQTGLIANSVVSCENLITISQSQTRWIGRLSPSLMNQVDAALKVSLALP